MSLPNLMCFKGRVSKPRLMSWFFLREEQREEWRWVTGQIWWSTGQCVKHPLLHLYILRILPGQQQIFKVRASAISALSSILPPSSLKTFPLFLSLCRPHSAVFPPRPNRNNIPWKSALCPCGLIHCSPSFHAWRRRTAVTGCFKKNCHVVIRCELTTKEFQLFVDGAYEACKSSWILHRTQTLRGHAMAPESDIS